MGMSSDVQDLLVCPKTDLPLRLVNGGYVSTGDPDIRFPIEEGILRAFIPHQNGEVSVLNDIRAFYEENPFPNYDDLDDLGSLIEKSLARGFPEMLNRSISPNATVLEAGCGTGQLGNFLSIAGRRVISIDACLNSLRLAQRFKESNGLTGVTFGQMNLFRLPFRPDSFDVIICTGVLHHTENPSGGFRNLLSYLKPGGKIIIGLYNRYGRLTTRLRRLLFALTGERAAKLDPYIRNFHIGKEKRRAWFMDQYRNPHESLHTIDEVLGWFGAAQIEFVRALPSTVFGSRFELEYHHSLFEPEHRGSRMDRLFSQLKQMIEDTEGGLFIMIGTKS
jgi:2-polyprenyl-3-methyl-5-hydroxy-6-metoxy-1,4-benzoquinol methylase